MAGLLVLTLRCRVFHGTGMILANDPFSFLLQLLSSFLEHCWRGDLQECSIFWFASFFPLSFIFSLLFL